MGSSVEKLPENAGSTSGSPGKTRDCDPCRFVSKVQQLRPPWVDLRLYVGPGRHALAVDWRSARVVPKTRHPERQDHIHEHGAVIDPRMEANQGWVRQRNHRPTRNTPGKPGETPRAACSSGPGRSA